MKSRTLGGIARASLAALILFVGVTIAQRAPITGDEPRYVYYAHSFFLRGDFHLDEAAWRRLIAMQPTPGASHLAAGDTGMIVANPGVGPSHAVGMPVLMSPLVGSLPSVAAGRFAIAALAAGTLMLLFGLLVDSSIGARTSFLALALAGVSVPFLPYTGLFYTEIPLAFLLAAGWRALHRPLSVASVAAVATVVLLIPFIHLRGVGVAFGLALILAYRILLEMEGTRRTRFLVAIGFAWLMGGILFAALNFSLYGSLLGSVTSANLSVSLGTLRELMFNFRHGALLFSPILAFGAFGLAQAAWSRSRLGIEGLIFLLLSVILSLGPNADESPPARFLVQAVPALAVGLALWLDRNPGILMRLAFLLAFAWTTAVSIDYLERPVRYLENRETCNTCLEIARRAGWGGGQAEYRMLSPGSAEVEVTIARREAGEVRSIEIRPLDLRGGLWTTRPIPGVSGIAIIRSTAEALVLRLTDNGLLATCAPISILITDTRGRELDLRPVECSRAISAGTSKEIAPVLASYKVIPTPASSTESVEGFGGSSAGLLGEIAIGFPEPIRLSAIDVTAIGANGGSWTTRPGALWGVAIHEVGSPGALRNPGARKADLGLALPASIVLRLPDNGSLAGCARLSLHVTFAAGNSMDIPAQCAERTPK